MSTGWAGWPAARETDALTRPRMLLGARLRRLREHSGLTLAAAAAAVGSPALLEAMERGMTRSEPRAVLGLAELYGVTDHGTRVALLELARQSHREGWWAPYRRLIRSGFLPYLGAEQAAKVIRCYVREYVPELLQHADYARAVLRLRHPNADEREIAQRLHLWQQRQRVILGARPAHMWAIVDPAVLHHPSVDARTMFRQLAHLLDLSELPHITVQLGPAEPGIGTPVSLVQLPERDIRQVVFLQRLDAALYPEDSDFHRHEMNALAIHGLSPEDTRATLKKTIMAL